MHLTLTKGSIMKSLCIHLTKTILPVLLSVLLAATAMGEVQKKGKSKPAATQTSAAAVDNASSEEVAPAESAAPAPQGSPSVVSGAIVDVLKRFQGQQTNLGILKKIGRDYIELQDENVTWTIPLTSIHSLKQTGDKDDNDRPIVKLDIKLYSKD